MAKKGTEKERRLVRYLINKGYMAVRVAGSGAGTPDPRPDILAGTPKVKYAIELKSSAKNMISISKKQVEELKEFCRGYGSRALVCVWFSFDKPCFLDIRSLSRTKGGNYKVSRECVHHLKKERKIVYL